MKAFKYLIWSVIGVFCVWAVVVSLNRDKDVETVPIVAPAPYVAASSGQTVVCQTTKGEIKIVVVPEWSPRAAERFLQLVDDGFFTNLPMFRCMKDFICQFGASLPKPDLKNYSTIPDDPQKPELRHFKPGYLSFAGFGPNSRATHIFISLSSADSLGSQPWETPFAYVTDDTMPVVNTFETSYGEIPPDGSGPDVEKIQADGGAEYLHSNFPLLDSFLTCARKN